MPCRKSKFESQLDTKSVDYLLKPLTFSRKPLVLRLRGRDEGSTIPTTPNCRVLLYFTLSPYWIDLLCVRSMFNFYPQLFNFFESFELKIIILIYFENNIIPNATRWKKSCKCIFIFVWISNEICQVQYFFWHRIGLQISY